MAKQSPHETDLDVSDFLNLFKIDMKLEAKEKEVQKEMDFEERKIVIIKTAKATYETENKPFNEERFSRSIDIHFSNRFEFTPPKRSLETWLAEKYVDRARIFRQRVVPGLIAIGVVAAGWGAYSVIRASIESARETGVEERIEEGFALRSGLDTRIVQASKSGFVKQMTSYELSDFNLAVASAKDQLNSTDPFFSENCPEGSSDDAVT